MKTRWIQMMGAGLLAAGWLWTAGGCENAETDTALAVDPPSSVVRGEGATVFLTAFDPDQSVYVKSSDDSSVVETNAMGAQIMLPLAWRVTNPDLGGILSSGGYSAVYESRGVIGQNVVIVEDRFGREGVAVINQRDEEDPAEEEVVE